MTSGHWYPQNTFLIELIEFAQKEISITSKRQIQDALIKKLKEESYPYIVVDMILREAILRRNNE